MPFRVPTHVTIRPGSSDELADVVRARESRRVLLVTDRGLAATGRPERIRQSLEQADVAVRSFDGVECNPRSHTVDHLAELARAERIDLVVGLGGGSVLDAAKAVAMLATNPGRCADFEGRNRFRATPLPFVAVPTTCGTGSEVTWVAVVSHEAERRKMSVKGDGMFPVHALVDPDLLVTLPAPLVAETGADALTHAVEAFVCRAANPISDALATEAIRLELAYLGRACTDIAGDAQAREAVMRASTLAGLAFGNADVAAVHCLSESLGGMFDVPHGRTNAALLVPVLRALGDSITERLARLHAAVVGQSTGDPAAALLDRLSRLIDDVGVPPFAALGIPRADFRAVAEQAARNNSNPSNLRTMGPREYLQILESL